MSVELNDITSGYSTGLINDNFQLVEDELNNNVLRRDGLSPGEPNHMEVGLDMNANYVYNLPEPFLEHQAARLQDVQNAISGDTNQANLIQFTPFGPITAENVQGAIQQSVERAVLHADNTTERDALTGLVAGQQVSVSGNSSSSVIGGAHYRWDGASFSRIGDSLQTVAEFGATYSADDSSAVQDSLSALGYAYIPEGKTCTFKNVELAAGQKLLVDGVAKLPDGSVDFDRLVYAAGASDVVVRINEIDGNYAGQTGDAGTHLVYLTDCPNADVRIRYAHDHYYPRSFVSALSPDGIRNSGTGAIFLYECPDSVCFVDRLENWGHEGVYIWNCDRMITYLGKGQGSADGDEYSGIQVSGDYSQLLYANVDYAGATGIGFDVRYGTAGNLISTRSRFFNGVNLGHDGVPSDQSVIKSIIVDGCDDNGINIVSDTFAPTIGEFTIKNAGNYGINQSDGATGATLSNGFVATSRAAQLNVFNGDIYLDNVKMYSRFPAVLNYTDITGDFVVGETVTGQTSGATANVVYYWNSTRKFTQVTSVSGTFTSGENVVGGTSGAVGVFDSNTSPQLVSKGGTVGENFSQVILSSTDPHNIGFVSIGGLTSVNVSNPNVRASNLPVLSPSNGAGAQAQLYISSVQDGQFTVNTGTGSAAGAGAGFRYSIL